MTIPPARAVLAHADVWDAAGRTSQALELDFAVLRLARQCAQAAGLQILFVGVACEELVDEHLRDWAARPRRRPSELRDVVQRLESEPPVTLPRLEAAWHAEWEFQSDTAAFRNTILRDEMGSQGANILHALMLVMPWEAARTQRLIDVGAYEGLPGLRSMEPPLTQGWPYEGLSSPYGEATSARWLSTTPLAKQVAAPGQMQLLASHLFGAETRRRVLPVQLALIAYRLEHGRLPNRLDELVGDYVREVPLDPYANTPIVYQPQGCEDPLYRATLPGQRRIEDLASYVPAEQIVAPGSPFLWVTGQFVQPRAEFQQVRGQAIDSPSYDRYWRLATNTHEKLPLLSQTDLWRTGWVLAVPPAVPAAEERKPTP